MAEQKLVLRSVKTEDLHFGNKIEGGEVQIRFEHKYSYSVKYAKETAGEGPGHCRGEFHVRLCDRELQDKFMAEATVIGFFDYAVGIPKEELHRRTYKELFPHVRALISAVTALCGVPPIMIPTVDIDRQDIYSIDMNGRKENP